MKSKILRILLSPLSGIFMVLFILLIVDIFLYGTVMLEHLFDRSSIIFIEIILLPAIIFSVLIQYFIVIPLWKRYKERKKIFGMPLVPFVILLCIVSGIIFGLVFWERIFGLHEFFITSVVGITAFLIYWTVNLITIRIIEKRN